MATLLTKANVKKLKTAIDNLQTQISKWESTLAVANSNLNDTIGSTFKAEYARGAKACNNMQTIIDILSKLNGDLIVLIGELNSYYTVVNKAAKK